MKSILASASWDKTVRLWDMFDSWRTKETLALTSDGELWLGSADRPGPELLFSCCSPAVSPLECPSLILAEWRELGGGENDARAAEAAAKQPPRLVSRPEETGCLAHWQAASGWGPLGFCHAPCCFPELKPLSPWECPEQTVLPGDLCASCLKSGLRFCHLQDQHTAALRLSLYCLRVILVVTHLQPTALLSDLCVLAPSPLCITTEVASDAGLFLAGLCCLSGLVLLSRNIPALLGLMLVSL